MSGVLRTSQASRNRCATASKFTNSFDKPGVLAIAVSEAVEMAAGAGDQYWAEPNLPSGIKHCILRRYLPIFLARTSMPVGKVVLMDGYAGRGVYEDGSLGSAGMMLEWALERENESPPVHYVLRFFEKKRTSFDTLSALVETYRAQGVDVTAERADVVSRLQPVVDEANGLPLFLFIDPTGVGLPFEDLISALNRPRNPRCWPPTAEQLISRPVASLPQAHEALYGNDPIGTRRLLST
jgi:hypothetical protein